MSDYPKFSVVIPTRNRARYLRRTLDAFLADGYPDLELIVVDGGSRDETVSLLQSYGSRVARWVSEPDRGEYFAINKGLGMATGEYIKLMSDDDVLRPGALKLAADYFRAHPETDIVFGQTSFWSEQRDGQVVHLIDWHMVNPARLTLKHWLREIQGVTSLAGFCRKRVFDRIGLFATEYACGDAEFWVRAAREGVTMGLMPDLVVDYYFTGTNGVITKRWQIAADMMHINKRYGNTVDLLWCVWRKYAMEFIRPYIMRPLAHTRNFLFRRHRRR